MAFYDDICLVQLVETSSHLLAKDLGLFLLDDLRLELGILRDGSC